MSIADHFNGMNDLRLKPRMLRTLVRDRLPDEKRPFPSSSELSSILSYVKTHGLLSERDSSPDPKPKVMEAWKSVVDEWVDRLISLISSNMPDKCWAGICLLGVTCESCTSHRFLGSYSLWFQKLLSIIQLPSSTHFVKVASCASLADLLTRLANFPNIKKDATSITGKLIQPVLNLLNEDGGDAVWEGGIDLLCTIINLFPSSIHRNYDNVEAVLVSKLMLAESNSNMSKKFAYSLSLLPKVRGDEDSWSLMMQKILIAIHALLNDVFQGIEEEAKSSGIMRQLVPPGKDPPPPLGGQLTSKPSEHATKMLPAVLIPRVSTLMHCCCMMLTNPYPFQVTVPIHHLLALVGRVLRINGSVSDSLLPFTTAMHQELLCAELPALHLDSLDLLIAVVKGIRSQLLPHVASVVRLLTEYFRGATLPSIRTKVYFIMQTLLVSFGVGMALYLAHEVTTNAFADLKDCPGNGALSSNMNMPKSTSDTLDQSSQRKRKNASASATEQANGSNVGAEALDSKMEAPLSVKIAALRTLEALLTAGGSLRSERWRSDVDSLLVNVAMDACDAGWASPGWAGEAMHPNFRDVSPVSQADFQLAALEALLASLLSPTHVRPPYLSQGLELFRRGKQETGTKLAAFCAHALLALEILIHPRALPLVDGPSPKSPAFDAGFGHKHQNSMASSFRGDLGSINDIDDDEDEDMYKSWLATEDDNATKQMEEPAAEKNHVDYPMRSHVAAGAIRENSPTADVEMASADREADMETRQHPSLGDAVSMRSSSQSDELATAADLYPGSLSSRMMESGKDAMIDAMPNKDTGKSSEKGRIPSYDSDSTSIGSLPDIVDADPDSDD